MLFLMISLRFTQRGVISKREADVRLGARIESEIRDLVSRDAAVIIRDEIRGVIDDSRGVVKRLHPFTSLKKGSSRPLINTQAMRDDLSVYQAGGGKKGWFVGYPRSKRESWISAWSNEFGQTIRVTEAMRKFMAAVKKPDSSRPATGFVVIPARPFMKIGIERGIRKLRGRTPRQVSERIQAQLKFFSRQNRVIRTKE